MLRDLTPLSNAGVYFLYGNASSDESFHHRFSRALRQSESDIVRQKCDSGGFFDSEPPEPRQLGAVAIGRGREGDHLSQEGDLGGAQGVVQQVLTVVTLMHGRKVVGEAKFHNIKVEIKIVDDRAGLGCGSFHQDAVVRINRQARYPRSSV